MTRGRRHTALLVAAYLGIGGWMVVLGGWLWWTLQPAALTSLKEPIPILNAGHEIAIGEPIRMSLIVDKPPGVRLVKSDRFLQCESGNLITLTPAPPKDLPPGRFTVTAENVVLPAKVTVGDTCVFTYRNTYRVNPIREETVEWSSELFTILPAR